MESTDKKDVYALVTERIITQLDKGIVPWKQPWTEAGLPRNLISGKPYRGINIILLSNLGYKQNLYLSFNQVKTLGGMVRKGEKSHLCVFWKMMEVEDRDTKEKIKKPFLRYYLIFNIEQCDHLPKDKIPSIEVNENHPLTVCEDILFGMPNRPKLQDKDHEAYYAPSLDVVNVPDIQFFSDTESYYAVLFHELIHSTGHISRLNRKEVMGNPNYGSEEYSIEELTAEIGACFLSSVAGIPAKHIENHAAYISGWLEVLKNDRRFVVFASTQAQKAADYILDLKKEEIDQPEEEREPNLEPEYIPFEEEVVDDLPF